MSNDLYNVKWFVLFLMINPKLNDVLLVVRLSYVSTANFALGKLCGLHKLIWNIWNIWSIWNIWHIFKTVSVGMMWIFTNWFLGIKICTTVGGLHAFSLTLNLRGSHKSENVFCFIILFAILEFTLHMLWRLYVFICYSRMNFSHTSEHIWIPGLSLNNLRNT